MCESFKVAQQLTPDNAAAVLADHSACEIVSNLRMSTFECGPTIDQLAMRLLFDVCESHLQ